MFPYILQLPHFAKCFILLLYDMYLHIMIYSMQCENSVRSCGVVTTACDMMQLRFYNNKKYFD